MTKKYLLLHLILFASLVLSGQNTYYVATNGVNNPSNGTSANPWATITYALDQVPDGSTILVKPGTYNGRVNMRGSFTQGVTVQSEIPYQAMMRHNDRVFTYYADARGCNGITLSGFDIAHSGAGSSALVVHVDGNGNGSVYNLTFENNIFHDSYNNDLLKINNSTYDITVRGNMFYNQNGSDEHIDINSVENVRVVDNVFFNDFAGSGRTNGNNTSSYIVIKDSNGNSDLYEGSDSITVARNIFLNWEGSTGSNFVLCGEDGQGFYEATRVLIENNLMIGNSSNVMRAPFGVKGCQNITFRHNTIVGDLPSLAYAFRFNQEGSNLVNNQIFVYNNIWSDPSGSMGSDGSSANDFSDTPIGETSNWTCDHNLYWNAGSSIPASSGDLINYTDDVNRIINNPLLPNVAGIIVPRWNPGNVQFADGSTTIRDAFVNLVLSAGTIPVNSPAVGAALSAQSPTDDVLGNPRSGPDMGAFEQGASSCPSHPTNTWIGGIGNWHTAASNWSENRIPDVCDQVIIPVEAEVTVSNGANAVAFTLEVSSLAELIVEANATLDVVVDP